ncbi:MAG TPA: hypothetical protein DCS93_20165 [Microscillaceae bacterium]|nr:hypothetical protein [Microscillaceae bacterium]
MKQLLKIGAITGLIGGSLFILFILILFWAGEDPLGDAKSGEFFVIMVVFVGLYFLYRYQLTFRQGFLMGNMATLVIVVMSVLFLYLFLGNKSNQVLDKHVKKRISMVENSPNNKKRIENANKQGKDGKKELANLIANLKSRKHSEWLSFVIQRELISKLVLGLIISLLLSVVLRKYRPKEPAPTE